MRSFKYPDFKLYSPASLNSALAGVILLLCKMKSKSKINEQLKRKRNPELVEAIISSRKHDKWMKVSEALSTPRKQSAEKNLSEINNEAKEGDVIVVPGKVLSSGEIGKKIKIVALKFSESAKEKITQSGSSVSTIIEEIKKNPEAKGVKVLR